MTVKTMMTDSCTEENHKVHQENNCKIENEVENDDGSDSNSIGGNSNSDITCWNFAQNPDDGLAIVDDDDDPLDIFAPIS